MLAAEGKFGKQTANLVSAIISAGGEASAAERNRKGKTAADIAEARGAHALAAQLKALEPAAEKAELCVRCPHCSAKLRKRSKLEFVHDKVLKGEEKNSLLTELFADDGVAAKLSAPEFHRISSCVAFRKEATESMALISELRRVRAALPRPPEGACTRVGNDWRGWHVVDLCCGSALTSAIALHLLPGALITAVDIVPGATLPHFDAAGWGGGPLPAFAYIESDVHSPALIESIRARTAALAASLKASAPAELPASDSLPRVAVLGMHCCGTLSLRVIEIFDELGADVVLIMPCCLPPKPKQPVLAQLLTARAVDEAAHNQAPPQPARNAEAALRPLSRAAEADAPPASAQATPAGPGPAVAPALTTAVVGQAFTVLPGAREGSKADGSAQRWLDALPEALPLRFAEGSKPAGSKSATRFARYAGAQSLAEFLALHGGSRREALADLEWDVAKGHARFPADFVLDAVAAFADRTASAITGANPSGELRTSATAANVSSSCCGFESIIFGTSEQMEQYRRWAGHICARVSERSVDVRLREVTEVLSERNALVSGVRRYANIA